MTDVLALQQQEPEAPGEEKRSDHSWFACGGKKNSNGSYVFC